MADVIEDAKGRKLTLREADATFALALAEAAGDASTNVGFIRLASVYLLVDEIDGVPIPFPHDKQALYAVAKQLGAEGIAALTDYLGRRKPVDQVEKAKN